MRSISIPLPFLFMFFTAFTSAQKKQVIVHWKIGAYLPAETSHSKALGIAGLIAGISNDVLIVAGGSNFPGSMPWFGGKKKYYKDVYVFKNNSKDLLENYRSFKLPFSVAYAASCTTPQGIFYAGGENENGICAKVFLIQWDPINKKIIFNNLPDLPLAVTNAAVTCNGKRVYLAGGETTNGVSNVFFCLDLDNIQAGWKALPSLLKPVSHAVMLVQSNGSHNCIYLIGGRKKNSNSTSDLYSSTFQFDLKTNKWIGKNSLPYHLSAGTGIATANNSILLFGGDKGETFHRTEELIVAFNNEKDSGKRQELNRQKIYLQSSHPGFSKQVLLYNTVTDKWSTVGNIPFETPVTTIACTWGHSVIIPGGEIKAGVRTPQILIGKLSLK